MEKKKQIKAEYDYELIVSRKSPLSWESLERVPYSIPAFYDFVDDEFYLNLSKTDMDYYQIINESEKDRIIASKLGPEFLVYPESDIRKKLRFGLNKLSKIAGVTCDSFHLYLDRREYWRFLFFREQLNQVSNFILYTIEERKNIENAELQIEYMGKPHDLREYLKKYKYSREVVCVKVLEYLSKEYLEVAPLYAHPFHYDLKIPDFGNGITNTIRFSDGKCETKGSLQNQIIIRDNDPVITEDTRIGVINTAFFDFKNKVFIPILGSSCDYNGTESTSTFIIDKSNLNRLIMRIKESNEVTKNLVHLYVQSVEDYYLPPSTAESEQE